jgi:hypothetical protein
MAHGLKRTISKIGQGIGEKIEDSVHEFNLQERRQEKEGTKDVLPKKESQQKKEPQKAGGRRLGS